MAVVKILFKSFFIILLFSFLCKQAYSAQTTDWVSARTISSVVKLGKIYDLYIVEGMADNHTVSIEYDTPNFGNGKIVKTKKLFKNMGSGVIVSDEGWIFSNAHVVDDYSKNSIYMQYLADKDGNSLKDKNGITVKAIFIPSFRGFVWVTMTAEEYVKNNIRKSKLVYLAKTFFCDKNYDNYNRDRAILKIIAGDFNSTGDAALNVKMREHLNDTWLKAGSGLGATRYWGDFLPLRIDYIYATKDFSMYDSSTIPADCSDHLPVVSSVFLEDSN